MEPSPPPENIDTPISGHLLAELHASAQRLLASDSLLLRSWGEHLMQKWRSLALLAERYRSTAQWHASLSTSVVLVQRRAAVQNRARTGCQPLGIGKNRCGRRTEVLDSSRLHGVSGSRAGDPRRRSSASCRQHRTKVRRWCATEVRGCHHACYRCPADGYDQARPSDWDWRVATWADLRTLRVHFGTSRRAAHPQTMRTRRW